ncbi:MAG: DUF362 domain-containing protein [Armatimonadota bacterium]
MGNRTTRREFLKQAAAAGLAIAGLNGAGAAVKSSAKGASGKSRVVIAKDMSVLGKNDQISQSVLDEMLNSSLTKLTDTQSASLAWKKLFAPTDVVGIKVNALFGKGVSTHPEVVESVIRGLKSAGVKADNIIVWDRATGDLIKSGFKPNKDGAGVKFIADDGDWGEVIEQGAFKGRISKIIADKITAMVNVPILKTHGIAGISCCLKNHYGSFNNPGDYHANHCNPAMADFSAIPMVKDKTRLVVIDALRAQYDAGPGPKVDAQFNYYGLICSTDPVAADYQGLEIIQAKRKEVGLAPIPAADTAWLQSAQERGVGICDPARIELINV